MGSLSMRLRAKAEEGWDAATGLAAGLACGFLEVGLEGSGLAVVLAMLEGGAWAGGEAEVVAGLVDDVPVATLAAVARDEAGVVAGALEEIWAGGVDGVLAAAGALVLLQLLQGGIALQLCVDVGVDSISIGVAVAAAVWSPCSVRLDMVGDAVLAT